MGKRPSIVLLAHFTLAVSLAFLLGACSKSSSPTGPGAGAVITVTGKVVGINNQPVASVPVLVPGIPSVNTDANGTFTLANVTTPYTLIVVDGASKRALIYRGLTRSDPTLFWLGASPGTSHTAGLAGTLIPPPAAGTKFAKVAFASPDAAESGSVNLGSGTFNFTTTWYGPSSTIGTLYALVWEHDASSLPTTYDSFGKRSNITILDGTTNSGQNDTLGTAQTGQISGTVVVPSGYTLSTRALYAVFESKTGIPLLSDPTTVANFSYKTPDVPGAAISLVALVTNGASSNVESFLSGMTPNQTNATMTIPAAPELSLPVNNATGISTGTPFSWTQFTGGIHIISFTPTVSTNPSFLVITAATSDTIPNLTSVGLPLPASASYKWSVDGVAPFASIDAAAGTGGPLGFITNTFNFTGAFGNSATRTFTTAP